MNYNKPTLFERFRYRFENTLSAGTVVLLWWLIVIGVIIVIIAGTIVAAAQFTQDNESTISYIEAIWDSLIRSLDPGTMGNDTGWGFRIVMLFVTLSGVFLLSLLIGIITNSFKNRIDYLRRGKSRILESCHTLIVRWSPKIFTIISELIIANENKKNSVIVILGDKDKVEMEEEINSKIPDTKNTKVICRSGRPLEITDIEMVNPHDARSIIIISPEAPNPDTHVIKSVLALTNNPHRRKDKYHIVAEIKEEANLEAAKVVGRDEVTYVLSYDVVAKVTAQTCRQSGLSVVYTELLDYAGDEIYFQLEPRLVGRTFKESLFAYEDSAVIGLQYKNGKVQVNPPMNTMIREGDKIIAISEDDDTVILSGKTDIMIDRSVIKHEKTKKPPTEKSLILGWNEKGGRIIKELDNYAAPGSKVLIMAEYDGMDETLAELNSKLKNKKVEFKYGNITFRSQLDAIDIPSFDHIIILSYTQGMDIQEADAQTLICLLHLRNISEQCGKHFSIVSEILDVRNQSLAEVARADDFIISDKLISLMLTQFSENKYLKYVFDDFFDAEGSEIYLKPVTDYVEAGKSVNFYTVIASAAQFGEVAFGYRIHEHQYNPDEFFGVVVNPDKSDSIVFSKEDRIIVLAED
ncbi:MAG: potassium transporter TrkA [Bacteroidetes bacterium]|nr:MAG: potassium transporter TrkA [Bacteroidota bacterium]